MKEEKIYYSIKDKLLKDESYAKIKDYSKERHRVMTYYEVGKMLFDAGKHYGEDIIGNYSKKLMIDVDKKFNKRTLFRIRQFYEMFSNEKVSIMSTQLTWSHYREILKFDDINVINFYLKLCVKNNLSVRELQIKIKNKEYDRLDEDTRNKIVNNDDLKLVDTVKNPILIRNTTDNY